MLQCVLRDLYIMRILVSAFEKVTNNRCCSYIAECVANVCAF